ncbi:MAG: hypothetical protein OJF51_003668 [Nitrospira sp.]|jgi:ribosomal protein L35AE/L33A|nr:MAG: hypothetical protein OJF51_003668 [Nitrospira sp.]
MLEKMMRSHDDLHNQQSHRHPSLGLVYGGNIVAVHQRDGAVVRQAVQVGWP